MNRNLQLGSHPDADKLSVFAEGASTAREREQMLAHLADCAECRAVVFLMQQPEKKDAVVVAGAGKWRWQRWFLPVGLAGAAVLCGLTAVMVHVRFGNNAHGGVQQIASEQTPGAGLHGGAVSSLDKGLAGQYRPPQAQQAKALHQTSGFGRDATAPHGIRRTHGPSGSTAPNDEGRSAGAAGMSAGVAGAIVRGEMVASPRPPAAMAAAAAVAAEVPAPAPAAPPGSIQSGAIHGEIDLPPVAGANANLQPLAAPVDAQRPAPQARPAARASLPMLQIEQSRQDNTLSGVSGRVTDRSGAAVSKAAVTLRDALGNTRQTTTNADGNFRLTGVPQGHYDLTVAAPGFQSNQQPIDLKRGELAMLQPVLNVGSVSEAVTVVSNAPSLETESANVGQISAKLPSRLPAIATATLGRTMLSLDSAGSLFLSRNAGRRWKKVRPRWTGKAVRIEVASAETGVHPRKDAASDQRIFHLTTETGAVWASEDGKHWHQQ